MSTLVPALCLLLPFVVLLALNLGALGLTLAGLFTPKSTRRSLKDQIAHVRHCWYERDLPKPKTPHDCPLCAALHPSSPTVRPAPPPYATVKSRRGRKKQSATEGFACLDPGCDYFGCTDAAVHALVVDGWDGKQRDIRRLRCQACQHVFSIRRNTPCFRLHKPLLVIQSAFVLLAFGMSRADIARFLGVDDDTVARWLDRFGAHADHLHDTFLHDLTPEILQLDELRAQIRGAEFVPWLWLAIDPLTKLVPAYAVAPRKTPDAMAFLHRLCDRLTCAHIPLFLSDGLRQYHAVLTAHFGAWVNGVWHVSPQLHLAQIVKVLRSRRLVVTFPRALCGSLRHARHHLRAHGFSGIIQTAFIERVNLTVRHGVGALHRRTWATCRRRDRLHAHVALYFSLYHFLRPHMSLKAGTLQRTPAMAAGLTDHRWTAQEWLTHPAYR